MARVHVPVVPHLRLTRCSGNGHPLYALSVRRETDQTMGDIEGGRLRELVTGALAVKRSINGLIGGGKSSRQTLPPKALIEATGDGDTGLPSGCQYAWPCRGVARAGRLCQGERRSALCLSGWRGRGRARAGSPHPPIGA